MKALRRGWYLGDESFRDKLLALAELKGLKGRKKTSHTSEVSRSHGIAQAEEMIKKSLDCLGFSLDKGNDWKKNDLRKVAIATRLEMGHENSINRHIRKGRTDAKTKNLVLKLEKIFRCVD